jgi:hypothetical protein
MVKTILLTLGLEEAAQVGVIPQLVSIVLEMGDTLGEAVEAEAVELFVIMVVYLVQEMVVMAAMPSFL